MKLHVALACSLRKVAVCIMDENRKIVAETVLPSDAATIAEYVRAKAPKTEVVGFESGLTC